MNEPNQSKVIAEAINSVMDDNADYIRESKLDLGFRSMRSKIHKIDIQTEGNCNTPEKPAAKKRYKDKELAEVAIGVYRDNINPKVEKKGANEKEVPDTIASRANMRAMANALAGMRKNGGDEGRLAPTAGPNGGSTGTPGCGNYYALTTSMTLEEYEEYINSKFVKEETQEEVVEQEQELLVEDPVSELEDKLLKMEDVSWTAIDKVMRVIAKDHDITPKELHKAFKAEHKMIPDEWVKKNQIKEHVGWFPLEEATRINKIGQVYEVSFLFRGGTQRLKFFWPEVGIPTRQQMEDACKKFWPGARLMAFYPSMNPGDNQENIMVMVPAMKEEFHIINDDAWVEMSEQESQVYQMICEEEGEPISPPMIQDDGTTLLLIEDHDTGEVHEVIIEANKSGDASLHDWFSKSKSSDGKKGWVQLGGKYAGKPCAKQEGQTTKPKCGSSKMKRDLNKKEEDAAFRRKNKEDGNPNRSGKAKNVATEEVILEKEGKKDACYNKVKSRYKVWPSAYASGALVKCRKAGAANWGNSSKKEEVEYMDENRRAARAAGGYKDDSKKQPDPSKDGFTGVGNMSIKDIMKMNKDIEKRSTKKEEVEVVDEACWKGYTKKGMKTMFGKRYPNCVKKTQKEEAEYVEEVTDKKYKAPKVPKNLQQKDYDEKMSGFSPERPRKEEAEMLSDLADGLFEDMKGMSQKSGDKRSTESGAGMTAKGVAKYNSRTGGNLKTAVTTPPSKLKPGSKAAGRRKSFCARSKSWNGERGKAARRRWNC